MAAVLEIAPVGAVNARAAVTRLRDVVRATVHRASATRPKLVCQWQQDADGRLACQWDVEIPSVIPLPLR